MKASKVVANQVVVGGVIRNVRLERSTRLVTLSELLGVSILKQASRRFYRSIQTKLIGKNKPMAIRMPQVVIPCAQAIKHEEEQLDAYFLREVQRIRANLAAITV